MPGKKQVRLAFCDLAPDWDARDNYFTQALEHAGWEITFCNGPEEKPDFVLCGTFGFDFLSMIAAASSFPARTAGRT